MQETRKALYDWMAGILQDRGWTAAEWSRRAGVTPTNLTRFLRAPEIGSVPGAETIGRLARAAGSEPRFLDDGAAPAIWRVPLLGHDQLRMLLKVDGHGAVRFLEGMLRDGCDRVVIDSRPSPRAFALRITSRHLNAGGVIDRDQVVVEPMALVPPRTGDLVIVLDGSDVCGYRYYPPYLVPVSTDEGCVPMPCSAATVLGVGVHVRRDLRR